MNKDQKCTLIKASGLIEVAKDFISSVKNRLSEEYEKLPIETVLTPKGFKKDDDIVELDYIIAYLVESIQKINDLTQ